MVNVRTGDLFRSEAQTWVNTVNTVGVMGKGLALEFKRRFPEMFEDYAARCARGDVHLGEPYLYKRAQRPWILNFPTKEHWRGVSRIDAIERGLRYLVAHHRAWGIESLEVPPLGCGLGQLDWSVVGPTLYRELSALDIPVELYAPAGTPEEQLELDFLDRGAGRPRAQERDTRSLPAAWIAIAAVVKKLEAERTRAGVTRIELQKLAYFSGALGLPTELVHERGSYGPFAPGLKVAMTRLVNNGVIREEQRGKAFVMRPGPTLKDAIDRHRVQIEAWAPQLRRLTDLMLRVDARHAELAATVHFVAKAMERDGRAPSELDVFDGVRAWKLRRRPPVADAEIAEAVRSMNALGWVDLAFSESLPLPLELRFDDEPRAAAE